MPVVEKLADWVVSLAYDDIPPRVLERARHQIVNVMASLYAGTTSRDALKVVDAVRGWSGPGPCTLIPLGDRLRLFDAVYAASALGMALDYDDYLYMGHTGHSSVLASWAVGEAERRSTREVLVAQVIANEIGGRVGASVVLGPQNGQAWSFIHAAGAAAASAKLYRLDRAQTAHALSIALYQPTFTLWPGFMGPGSKVLTAAGPTVTGIQAAELARAGLTGARRIFEHPKKGFWASFSYVPLPGMMTGLGHSWVTDTLAYKKYPGCAYIDTTMDALFMVLREFEHSHGRTLRPEEVRGIEVEASLLSVEMDNLSAEHVGEHEPLSPVNINFSIPFNVALGVLAGRHTPAELDTGVSGRARPAHPRAFVESPPGPRLVDEPCGRRGVCRLSGKELAAAVALAARPMAGCLRLPEPDGRPPQARPRRVAAPVTHARHRETHAGSAQERWR